VWFNTDTNQWLRARGLMGRSIAEVTGAVGPPTRILNQGPLVVYVYPDMKVTFKEGKVSGVE